MICLIEKSTETTKFNNKRGTIAQYTQSEQQLNIAFNLCKCIILKVGKQKKIKINTIILLPYHYCISCVVVTKMKFVIMVSFIIIWVHSTSTVFVKRVIIVPTNVDIFPTHAVHSLAGRSVTNKNKNAVIW